MINDVVAIADLTEGALKMPIQKVVDRAGLDELVGLCSSGDYHAYISEKEMIDGERWLVTVMTRSASKWHAIRDWRAS